ncbi:MAG: hypothetical protein LBU65_12515, partial [Planctomycetaceae bacterium]|nr:hypothetical protein [Planctomycetaceae bacterium]
RKLMSFRGENFEYFQQDIPAGEELNAELLDAMVFALNDLKIVDVVRKPDKLRDAIRERASLEKLALDTSLASSGFNIVQMPDIKVDKSKLKVELLSANGDFRITLKNGVVYVLRFGDAASMAVGDDGDGKTNEENIGMNRYLFIMSEFDEEAIPKPELRKPSELPADADDAMKADFAKMNEEIEKQNKRADDEYEATIKEGRDRAAKLNERFSSWYYVISEEVYKKIHLDRKSVFKPIKADEKTKDKPLADPLAIPEIPEIQLPQQEGKPKPVEESKPVEKPAEESKPVEQPTGNK